MGGKEASCVDAAVCAEFDVELIAGRVDGTRQVTATQLGQLWSTAAVAIMYLTDTDNRNKMKFRSKMN